MREASAQTETVLSAKQIPFALWERMHEQSPIVSRHMLITKIYYIYS